MSESAAHSERWHARFAAADRAWFEAAFAEATPAQTGPGTRSPAASTPLSSPRPAPARPWPPSCPPSTGCVRPSSAGSVAALPGRLHQPAQSAGRGCRAQSAISARRYHTGRRSARPGRPDITVAMRSGDTSADERRLFARRPADILITTPESLFLLLTSAAREALRGVDTVIVDEVHAVCASKRGAHLALSLERLDALLERPAQRIGLSATVRPISEVATFLAGGRPVTVVAPPARKTFDLRVVVPVEDMSALGRAHRRSERSGRRRRTACFDLAARRGASTRSHRVTPIDHRLRQFAPAGRAADCTAQRTGLRTTRRRT